MNKNKDLFMDDYLFTGSHEDKVRKLTSEIDNTSGAKIFNSAIELYMTAAIVGCYYKKRVKKEKGDKTFRIMQNQFSNHYNQLLFIYKLVMLNDANLSLQDIDKINNAFRSNLYAENIDTFEEYMLGGIDILYDKIFVSTNSSYDDYLASVNSLLLEFKNNNRENDTIDFSEGVDL